MIHLGHVLHVLVADAKTPQNALRASFLSTFSTTAEQVIQVLVWLMYMANVHLLYRPQYLTQLLQVFCCKP